MKFITMQNNSHMSTILKYEVFGSELETWDKEIITFINNNKNTHF